MTGTPYQQGNPVTLDATFLVGSTPTDPTTITFKIRGPDGTLYTYVYLTDVQVTKLETGVYECAFGIPPEWGQYHYEAVGTGTCEATLVGEFYVVASSVDIPVEPPGPILGPCQTWIEGEDLVALCGANAEDDAQLLDAIAVSVSMLAYNASGRQYGGLCERTVRPCGDPQNGCWTYNWGAGIYAWWGWGAGYGWGWYGPPMGLGGSQAGPLCGCSPLSRVKLSGYPVREIVEVKINGDVLPATYDDGSPQYRLDGWTWLTRMNDPAAGGTDARWPSCQVLALDDTEQGTFSVTYKYGVAPPPMGILACEQLACEFYAAFKGGDCQLPNNVTKIVRQGLTQERITPLAAALRTGATGIIAWDSFLADSNPNGLRRRPAVYSPDVQPYAPRVGNT